VNYCPECLDGQERLRKQTDIVAKLAAVTKLWEEKHGKKLGDAVRESIL